jgi:signal transduction histidine kinase
MVCNLRWEGSLRRWDAVGQAALLALLAGLWFALGSAPGGGTLANPGWARGLAAAALGLAAGLWALTGRWRQRQGEAEERLQAFLDHGPMNPYIKDADGTVLWVGRRMRENFPQSPRWVGQKAMAGISPDMTQRLNAQIPGILAGTEAKFRSSLLAAHDLQEPLRKIQAFGERLALALPPEAPAQARQDLTRILSASRRMRALIEALLSYSRVTSQARPLQPVDLGACLSEAWSDLELQAEACGGQLEAPELPQAQGDPHQLRQLFQNLLSNALKYRRPGVAPRIQVAARAGGGWLELTFRDNGIGFDPAYREKVFELFQRLHGRDEYEGTGMGLATCRKIAERHGGRLQADAKPGEGATFTLLLPHHAHLERTPS